MSEAKPLLTFERKEPVTVGKVHSASVIDALNVTKFGEEVLAYVSDHPGTHLLLNFEEVSYLSSAVLTELIRINKELEATKGSLRLCCLNADIRKVFEITNLDKMFVISDGEDEAIRRFKRSLNVEAEEDSWTQINPE
jgi:anti-sigma B factor antagonist